MSTFALMDEVLGVLAVMGAWSVLYLLLIMAGTAIWARQRHTSQRWLQVTVTLAVALFVILVVPYVFVMSELREQLPPGDDDAYQQFAFRALLGLTIPYLLTLAVAIFLGRRWDTRPKGGYVAALAIVGYFAFTALQVNFISSCLIGSGIPLFPPSC